MTVEDVFGPLKVEGHVAHVLLIFGYIALKDLKILLKNLKSQMFPPGKSQNPNLPDMTISIFKFTPYGKSIHLNVNAKNVIRFK